MNCNERADLTGSRMLPTTTAADLLAQATGAGEPTAVDELVPTGRLRAAMVVGLAPSAFAAVRDPESGGLRGVPVVLFQALAESLALPLDIVPFLGVGEIELTAGCDMWDVSLLPADDERRKAVTFGAAYHILNCAYLVPAGSPIKRLGDADAPGVRIVGLAGGAALRGSLRASPRATHITVASPDDAVALMHGGSADVIALGRESLRAVASLIEGSRILDGTFFTTTTAVAVPRGRLRAVGLVSAFVEDAKASGLVRRALDELGLPDAPVAPAGAYP